MASSDSAEGGFAIHPMDQFIVKPLFGGELGYFSVTNATLWMAITVVVVSLLLIAGTRGRAMVPTRMQSIAELMYGLVRQMVVDIAGEKAAPYFPYIFTLFVFILFANLVALIPYSLLGDRAVRGDDPLGAGGVHLGDRDRVRPPRARFFALFWPMEAPAALRPVLCVIEVISYFVRPVSHSIRLGANLMAGHAVLKVFAGFAGPLGVAAVMPIAMMVAVYGLEVLVAVIQAYVFTILTCVYLNDAIDLHGHGADHHDDHGEPSTAGSRAAAKCRGAVNPVRLSNLKEHTHGRISRASRGRSGLHRHGWRRHRRGQRGRQLPRRRDAQPGRCEGADRDALHRHRIRRGARHLLVPRGASADVRGLTTERRQRRLAPGLRSRSGG